MFMLMYGSLTKTWTIVWV